MHTSFLYVHVRVCVCVCVYIYVCVFPWLSWENTETINCSTQASNSLSLACSQSSGQFSLSLPFCHFIVKQQCFHFWVSFHYILKATILYPQINSCLAVSVNGLSTHNVLRQKKKKILSVMYISSLLCSGASINVTSLTIPWTHPFNYWCRCDISWHVGNVFYTWLGPLALHFHDILVLVS